jgi:hypothetical protein
MSFTVRYRALESNRRVLKRIRLKGEGTSLTAPNPRALIECSELRIYHRRERLS